MKQIVLADGSFATVDDEDYERVSTRSWYIDNDGYIVSSKYLGISLENKGMQDILKLHRFVLNAPKGTIVDHLNGIKEDCQKTNLRFVDKQQNTWNRRPTRLNRTGYKGVTRAPYGNKWRVHIMVNGKNHYLGSFTSSLLAAQAYNEKAKEFFGVYAYLNPV